MSITRVLLLASSSALISACGDYGSFGFRNSLPSAVIESPTEDVLLFQGIPQRFRGVVQDLDDAPEELLVTWLNGDDVELCPASPPNDIGETFCEITLDAGPTEIRLVVTDGSSRGSDVKTFWARPSAVPEAEITSLGPELDYYADQIIDFDGVVSDVEDEAPDLDVWWESSIDGELEEVETTPSQDGRVSGLAYLTEGDHQIRLWVRDRAGNESFDSTVVRVGPANRAPECGEISVLPSGNVVRFGTRVTLEATATDPDVSANDLSVTWESDLNGPLGTSTPTSSGRITLFTSDLQVGTHVIRMEVEDAFDETCTATTFLTVDTAPIVTITSPQASAVYEDSETVTFSAVFSDAEDDNSQLRATFTDDVYGLLLPEDTAVQSDGTLTVNRNSLTPGPHLLTVTVKDTSDLVTSAQIPYSINALPGPAGIELVPADPQTDDPLTVQVNVPSTDPDGDNVELTVRWFVNGAALMGLFDPYTVPSNNFVKGDIVRVEVTPSDPFGDGPTTTLTTTIRNTAPELVSVDIPGEPFFETSTLTCTPSSATDADGDSISYNYAWIVNGSPIPVTTQTLTGTSFDKADTVFCRATPTDGETRGQAVESGPVTIINTVPQVSNAAIDPAAPEADDTLTCSWDYSDDDGDIEESTVTWRRGGVQIGTGATLDTELQAGQVITCSVAANDGEASGNSTSTTATVVVSAPSIDSVDIDPVAPNAASTLTCGYSGFSDPQGDPDQSRYQWTINGSNAGTTDTLSTGFEKGDTVVCRVTPSDGDFDGTPVSDSVVIQNTPPTEPVVGVEPEFPLAGLDDLVCTVDVRSTDADGDPVTYDFSWTREGSPYFGAIDDAESSTIPGGDYSGLETWVCTATPRDNEGAGPAGSAEIFTLPSIEPKIATGNAHSCKLDRRGEVQCWGLNQLGRLQVPGDLFLDLDSGFDYSCGLTQDSVIKCWGVNTLPGEALYPPSGVYNSVSAGTDAACATQGNNGVVCWGSDTGGILSGGPTTGQYVQVSVGDNHACARRATSGTLVCWGNNSQGQIDAPIGSFTDLSSGALHNCAIKTNGELECWGNDGFGQSTPPTGSGYLGVTAGILHSCAVEASGSITCWGSNLNARATPQNTDDGGSPIVYADADATNHTCGINDAGDAFCWGPNAAGQADPP